MQKLYAFVRHNSGLFLSVPLCFAVIVYCYSCQSVVVSMVKPMQKVTRIELVAEVDYFLAQAEARFEDLDRQDLIKNTLFNSVLDLAQGKTPSIPGLLTSLGSILGVGAVIDNVRKRTHINTLKGGNVNAK